MRFKLFLFVLLITLKSFATHNRAGYIAYNYLGGGQYKFWIYTYTNPSSYNADECTETLLFMNPGGSGQITASVTCTRINNTPGIDLTDPSAYNLPNQLAQCPNGPGTAQGAMLLYPYQLPTGGTYGGVKYNIYEGPVRSFSSGIYIVGMVDPNLDSDIQNIGNGGGASADIAFALLDTIRLSNGENLGYNSTPMVTNPPIDNACYHQQFCYNPGMQDQDHDSLSYSLINFITGNTQGTFTPVLNAVIPEGIHVNPITGELCWTSVPNSFYDQKHGEYEIDMLITEYRSNGFGSRYKVGTMLFAIQILVEDCPPNALVNITPSPPKTCIEAGSQYVSPVITTSKPSSTSVMTLTASGVPLTGTNIGPNAIFSSNSGIGSASGTLQWIPSCEAVNLNPYYVTIQGSDNGTPANTNYSTLTLQVVSPAITNFKDSVKGDSIKLSWSPPPTCSTNQYNKINSYLIYRAAGCGGFSPNLCQTGVPSTSGYLYIGTAPSVTGASTLVWYDTNSGQGLPAGNSYSYLVIAKFDDGSLSMAPTNPPGSCITLHLGVPIITNVNVDTTDTHSGSIQIKWQKPILGGVNFDTTKSGNQGPYYFSVHKLDAAGTYTTTIYNSTPKYFGQLKSQSDTTFVDTLIDTQTKPYTYKVYFYANGNYRGSSAPASSIYVTGVGHDKKAVLSWTSQTPWKDTLYYIYRQNYTNDGYTLVDSTHATTDTVKHLTNNYTYCFKVRSVGTYENPNITSPLYNYSQKICVRPIDDSPPCAPKLSINGDCDAAVNKLTWTNPDHTCGINDVLKYYIYYTTIQDSTLSKIDSILNVNDTTYTTNVNTQSIAGCYVVVAVDSAGNQSPLNNESCTDNCPEYELPNIFTPNGDNANDFYIPVKNRYIRSVDFVLYNRWGEIIYENTNPALGWDGKSKQMKQPVPDGVYFYTCTVYEIHYNGLRERKLKGFVQLIR